MKIMCFHDAKWRASRPLQNCWKFIPLPHVKLTLTASVPLRGIKAVSAFIHIAVLDMLVFLVICAGIGPARTIVSAFVQKWQSICIWCPACVAKTSNFAWTQIREIVLTFVSGPMCAQCYFDMILTQTIQLGCACVVHAYMGPDHASPWSSNVWTPFLGQMGVVSDVNQKFALGHIVSIASTHFATDGCWTIKQKKKKKTYSLFDKQHHCVRVLWSPCR